MRKSVLAWVLCLSSAALLAVSLGGCAVARVGGAAVKTTAWAGKTAVKGTVKGARVVGRVATAPLRDQP